MGITPPSLLTEQHKLSGFTCGNQILDEWLLKKAYKSQKRNHTKVYVVTDSESHQVVGFYAIAMGSVYRNDAIGPLRRNSPNPIPMVVLARLGVHDNYQGCGIGVALLKDCVVRSMRAMEVVGGAGILVHAIDESAKQFYKKFGFVESQFAPMTLMARICDIRASFI